MKFTVETEIGIVAFELIRENILSTLVDGSRYEVNCLCWISIHDIYRLVEANKKRMTARQHQILKIAQENKIKWTVGKLMPPELTDIVENFCPGDKVQVIHDLNLGDVRIKEGTRGVILTKGIRDEYYVDFKHGNIVCTIRKESLYKIAQCH